jgi:Cobalamin-independent synthase, Catalytic domain
MCRVSRDGQPFSWPASSATGIGSMPGTRPVEAVAVVLGELPEFPHLPELPARGPGADMIGRTAALLVDMPVETTARGWRLAERRGRDLGRAAGFLAADLDATEAATAGFAGTFKVQACGPWTLAAALELTRSIEPALADPGAVSDLTASLAEGLAAHVAVIRRMLPQAAIVVQVDEPGLPGVLAGSVPTASGLRRVPPVEEPTASAGLGAVLAAAGTPTIVHCCAPAFPFGCVRSAGADAVSFDLSLLLRDEDDSVGAAAEAGLGLLVGAVPAPSPGAPPSAQDEARQTAADVMGWWRRIGLADSGLAEQVVVTPACGLAGASPGRARAVLARCQSAARMIPELMEEGTP